MTAIPELELPLPPTPMKPSLFANAFPAICDKAGEDRPFLSPWLCQLIVLDISDEAVITTVPPEHKDAYVGLTQPNTIRYLTEALAKEMNNLEVVLEIKNEPIPSEAPAKSRSHNKLTLQQQLALGTWVNDHAEQIKKTADSKMAEEASFALRFNVTASNITSTREALGIEKAKPAAPPSTEERLAALEAKYSALMEFVDYNKNLGNLEPIPAKEGALES